MKLQCSTFQQKLTDFLNDELSPEERRYMELHILECSACRSEAEKSRKMIELMGKMPYLEVPNNALELTQRRIAEKASRRPLLKIPRWGVISSAAIVLTALFIILGIQLFVNDHDMGSMSVTAYLQQHESNSLQMVLPTDFASTLARKYVERPLDDTDSDESMAGIDMLLEVYYDTRSGL